MVSDGELSNIFRIHLTRNYVRSHHGCDISCSVKNLQLIECA